MTVIQEFLKVTSPDNFQDFVFSLDFPFSCSLFWKDNSGKYRANNKAHCATAGILESKDLLGLTDYDLIWSNSATSYIENDQKVLANKTSCIFLEQGPTVNHETAFFLCAKKPLFLQSQKTDGILGLGILFHPNQSNELFSHLILEDYTIPQDNQPYLTAKQLNCLFYLVLGMSHKEIASQLNLAPKTIEHHFEKIKIKLQCKSRAELIKVALKIPHIRTRLKMMNRE